MTCGNCKTEVDEQTMEFCWYCTHPLCSDCWESVGHCGHKRAEEINQAGRKKLDLLTPILK